MSLHTRSAQYPLPKSRGLFAVGRMRRTISQVCVFDIRDGDEHRIDGEAEKGDQ